MGAEDLAEKVQAGEIEFDRCIATPDMMGVVGRLGKILGPRGLMPNPRLGTVTMDVKGAIKAAKGGQVEFRAEKAGIIHAGIGKAASTTTSCWRTPAPWRMRSRRPSRPAPRALHQPRGYFIDHGAGRKGRTGKLVPGCFAAAALGRHQLVIPGRGL